MIRYGWEDVNRAVVGLYIQLERELAKNEEELVTIVGIQRGGLIPAVMLSHAFNVEMKPLIWQTRDQVKSIDPRSLCHILYGCKQGQAILIVDDIADSGKTFNDINRHVGFCNATNSGKIYYAALIKRSTHQLDMPILSHCFLNSGDWVHFPWEAG